MLRENLNNSSAQVSSDLFRVTHSGGLKVRKNPSLDAELTGDILECGKIVSCKNWIQVENAWFAYVLDINGWVVAHSGSIKALERIEAPKRIPGDWFYEGI